MRDPRLKIDVALVRRLVAGQFPQWKDLPVRPVEPGGWDNKSFHLGDGLLVRMPSAEKYAVQVEKEHSWLPRLAPLLPLSIPEPLAIGDPGDGYPWRWSVYRWIEGKTACSAPITQLCQFATDLAQFLIALQRIDPTGGPVPGPHSFFRGGALQTYDGETQEALAVLKGKIDVDSAAVVWNAALASSWRGSPVWVHGDVSPGNLLMLEGRLSGVIDFGMLSVGDPACDLVIAWTFFSGRSREVFRSLLAFDAGTWARARGWVLWKALIVAARLCESNSVESQHSWRVIDEVLACE